MSELVEALSPEGAEGKGDMVSRLNLNEVEREALDAALIEGYYTDAYVAALLNKFGHHVTANAVTYYRNKITRVPRP